MLIVAGGALNAAGLEPAEQRFLSERPGPAGAPTSIKIGIYLLDVDEIDDVRQRFAVDLFINVAWRDTRLIPPEEERSGRVRTLPLDAIWSPRALIINDRGLTPQLPRVVDVDDTGIVTYRQRLSGELAADLEFREFPFDTQHLPIEFVSYGYSPDEIRLEPGQITTGAESFSVEGWRLQLLEPAVGELTLPAAEVVRPRLTALIEARRDSRYYVLTLFLPMALIVFMAWTAFWIQPNVVPPRIAISTASIFSLIAFGLSVRLSLPRVSYLTRADLFVVGCQLLVFLALGAAVIGSRWASADRMAPALRLNAAMRWIYVLLFGVVAATFMRI